MNALVESLVIVATERRDRLVAEIEFFHTFHLLMMANSQSPLFFCCCKGLQGH
jgi:hypothetical protein